MKGFGQKDKSQIKKISKSNNKLSIQETIHRALQLHSRGKIKEAAIYYQYFINQGFQDGNVFSNYGAILRSLKKFKEAEKFLRKAIEVAPNFAMAYSNLGNTLYDLGKLKEAEKFLRKAIDIDPYYVMAYSNLSNILKDLGKLKEAEKILLKAIEIKPGDKIIEANLINLLTLLKPEKVKLNNLFSINEEFKIINISTRKGNNISDERVKEIYMHGLDIYKKHNLNLVTPFSQIFKKNEKNLNCRRHMLIFNEHKIIPEFCFECYKVQVEVNSVIELIKLFLVFNSFKCQNTRKCMVETRKDVSGFYKGLIYCSGLKEALKISEEINIEIKKNIRTDLKSNIKRGCSEYALEYPEYKKINLFGNQPMDYNKNWSKIEKEFDKSNNEWGQSNPTIEGFNLNNFLVIRNWLAYAKKIGDKSVMEITNEEIRGSQEINNLNRNFNL